MAEMTIERLPRDREHPYTMKSNHKSSFEWDKRLSSKPMAYTILNKMLTMKPGIEFSIAWLCSVVNRGEYAVRTGLKHLRELGYLIIERLHDESGKFSGIIYHFFESPQTEGEKPSEFCTSHTPIYPHVENSGQLNTTCHFSNTGCLSVSQESTEGQTAESEKETIRSEMLEAVDNLLKDVENSEEKDFLTDIVCADKDMLSRLEAIQNTEHTLKGFMQKLRDSFVNSLKNLKRPDKRDKFLKSVTINTLKEYIMKKPASEHQGRPAPSQPEKPMDFRTLLIALGHPYAGDTENDAFDSMEAFRAAYSDDITYWEMDCCQIPHTLAENPADFENALCFLLNYHEDMKNEEPNFRKAVAVALTEAVITGKKSRNENADPYIIIRRLNECIRTDGSLENWFLVFRAYYAKALLFYKNKVRNRAAFLKKTAVNFLDEYQQCAVSPEEYCFM